MQKYFMTEPIYINENKIVTLILKNNALSDNRVISEQKRAKIEKEFDYLSETGKRTVIVLTQYGELTLRRI
jgi:hypothetical protein